MGLDELGGISWLRRSLEAENQGGVSGTGDGKWHQPAPLPSTETVGRSAGRTLWSPETLCSRRRVLP